MEPTHIFLTSLWCIGFWNAFDKGMILERAELFLQNHLPVYIYYPTIGCVRCMASVHGFVAYILFYHTVDLMVIPFIVCVSGLNVVLSYFLD
jgi:hypothetical protein